MKFNKIYIAISILATVLLVACNEYEDTVVPGPTVPADNPEVRFAFGNKMEYELDPANQLAFTLTVVRSNETSALEVPVNVIANPDDDFIIPSAVSFAANQDTASLTITMSASAPTGEALTFEIGFGDQYVNPYLDEYGSFRGEVSIMNWVKYASGSYESMYLGTSWAIDLYRAEGTDKYRFYDLYAEGYNFDFIWDGGDAITPAMELDAESGYYLWYPGLTGILALLDSSPDYTYYYAPADAFQFEAYWFTPTVEDWLDDYFYIEQRY